MTPTRTSTLHVCTHYSTMVPTYTVDLDQPPEMRWQKLITDKKADVSTPLNFEYTNLT